MGDIGSEVADAATVVMLTSGVSTQKSTELDVVYRCRLIATRSTAFFYVMMICSLYQYNRYHYIIQSCAKIY